MNLVGLGLALKAMGTSKHSGLGFETSVARLMRTLYIAKLKKELNDYSEGTIVEVASELCPGNMTGWDPFKQGWAKDKSGHRHIATFDYFDLEEV